MKIYQIFFQQWGGPRPKSGGKIIRGKTFEQFPKLKSLKIIHQKRFDKLRNSLDELRSKNQEIAEKAKISQIIKI